MAFVLAACGTGAMPSRSVATSASVPGVASARTVGWSIYHDPAYGFAVELPVDATVVGMSQSGAASVMIWRIPDPRDAADHATLEIVETTRANVGLCAGYTHGKPVALGAGQTGYEQDNLDAASATGAAGPPQVAASVVGQGLFTTISFTGQAPAATFLARWRDVWGHILASFAPGKGPVGTQPCG
ncbi:MAG TPA: hypothetical protein VF812_09610 [Ktedonobacterales bacterium]